MYLDKFYSLIIIMNKRKNNHLTLLLFLTLVSLISLVFDKETMGFYQLSALSFSSFSSSSLPVIDQSIIIIIAFDFDKPYFFGF